MGKASDYVIDYNKLNGGGDSVKGLHFGETIQQAYLGGTLVFNRAQYSIEAFDVLLTASGTTDLKDTALVDSIKTDRGGMQSVVGYTISPASIPANETSGELTGEYTVTQEVSGLSAKGKWTQGGDSVVGYTYSGLKVTSVSYAYVPAGGGFVVPVVAYSGTRTTVYASGKKVSATWGSNTTSLLSATGKALVTGASFHTVGDLGKVYAPSLGTTLSDSRAVAQITSLSIKAADGSTLSWTGTVTVYQAANVLTSVYGDLSLTATYSDVGAGGAAASLTLAWTQTRTDSYTSGVDPVVTDLSGTIDKAATTGNRITAISGTSLLTGASLITAAGAARGNVTASGLGYTSKIRTKVYTVSVTVSVNGKTATKSVTVYQAANIVDSYYTEPVITSVSSGDVGANGAAATISVVYTQSLVTTSTAIPTGKTEDCSGTTVPTSVTGSTVANGGSKSGVKVVADSWGNSVQSRQIVYKVTSLTINPNNKSKDWSGTLNVYQAANAVTKTTYGAYTLTLSASAATVVALGGTVTLSVVCSQAATYTYTSGSSKDVTLNEVAALSTSRGSLSITSVTGSGSSILTIPENTGAARSVTVTAIAGDGTTQKTATVSQAAVAYGFYSNTLGAIGASGGSLALQLISTRNGKDFAVGKSNVAVSGLSGASVSSVTAVSGGDTGEYSVIVDVPANTSTSSRDFTVTATQPTSGLTYVWEVTQSGIAVTKKKAFFAGTFTFGLNLSTGAVNYGFISVSNSVMSAIGEGYTGGTLSSLQFRLVKADGTVLVTKNIGNVTVSDESTSAVSLLSLSNSSGSADVVVQVRYDGALQQTCGVMIPSVS